MSHHLGGQKRTVVCSCGYQKKGSVREVNMVWKIHQKLCPDKVNVNVTLGQFQTDNSFNNVSTSKRGNPVKVAGKIITVHKDGVPTQEFIKGV
jgi:hypothetical protein